MALLYVNITAAKTQGSRARACIFVLWPTWMIWKLYEQNVTATAPPIARNLSIPRASIRRKAPSNETISQLAGIFPLKSRLYRGFVQSPRVSGRKEVFGMPPNIEPVHLAGSSGWALSQAMLSWAMPLNPVISLWSTTFPLST